MTESKNKKQKLLDEVAKHRQCPSCYGRLKGVGEGSSTQGNKARYKCDKCGHNWTVIVTDAETVIQHRVTEVIERHPSYSSERIVGKGKVDD